MRKYVQSFALTICLTAFSDFNSVEGIPCRRISHDDERGAWGGNGGWWGNSRSDWYGEYGTPEEYNHFGNYTTPHYSQYGYYNGYYSDKVYPHHGQYYNDSVDGGALYFSFPD